MLVKRAKHASSSFFQIKWKHKLFKLILVVIMIYLHSLKQAKVGESIKFVEPSLHWHLYPVPLVTQVPSPHQTKAQAVTKFTHA